MSEETLDFVPLDPDQVEAEMLAAAEAKRNDPAEQAAMLFTAYQSLFEKSVAKLKGKAHTRVLKALVMAPLVKVDLITEAEKEAFYFGDSMLQAKFVMVMDTYKNSAQELMDAADAAETTTEYTGEENAATT